MSSDNKTYWQNKIAAWTNEAVCKIFDIPNRDIMANEIRSVLIKDDNSELKSLITMAEHIASGLTRAALPADSSDIDKIILKHPLVKNRDLSFDLPAVNKDKLVDEIKQLISNDLEYTKDFPDEKKYKEIFFYLFFALNNRLRNTKEGEIGKLGAYWDILPADTRMPDHPMWHHFGLTSAIYSSLEKNKVQSTENLSIVVYSITPVQDFIMKARKLRDYWTGSVILSYLAFTGITSVIENLGPDHILYPSLHNQALMDQWLISKNPKFENWLKENSPELSKLNKQSKSIASFPNKFVFICNNANVHDVCKAIEKEIDSKWKETAGIVKNYIKGKFSSQSFDNFDNIWDKTIDKYWKYSWAATNFANIKNKKELEQLLPKDKWENDFETMTKFEDFFEKKENPDYDASNLYGATHSLVQGLLAAGKNKPTFDIVRNSQNGQKCPLCGENEVLNNSPKNIKASEYGENITQFWNTLREKVNSDDSYSQVGKKECLCAVCALKRFLPLAISKHPEHILFNTLRDSNASRRKFPSTTEMSAHEYLKTVDDKERENIIKKLHNAEVETDENTDNILKNTKEFETKYYAFLLMDGDKMGDLINGETTEASWKDVLNIKEEKKSETPFKDSSFENSRRTINPALHSMISDSLNNFARYGVQPLVNNFGEGKLIYAGGDDVCAIMPLSTALETADKIRQVYSLSYAEVTSNGSSALLKGEQGKTEDTAPVPEMAKIVTHLGHSDKQNTTKISLSGAIIIAHHKQPLKEVIMDAHKVLDGIAKDKSGRNSLAIRLKKRSGGARDVWFKWEDVNMFADDGRTCKDSFLNVMKAAGKKELSTSLLYKIEQLKGYVEPFVNDCKKNSEQIVKLFEYELAHSGFINEAPSLAVDVAGICIKHDKKNNDDTWYNPEAAVIANFMGNKSHSVQEGGQNE